MKIAVLANNIALSILNKYSADKFNAKISCKFCENYILETVASLHYIILVITIYCSSLMTNSHR